MDYAFHYWTQTAHTKAEAQALAATIGREIPQGTNEFYSGLMYRLRRLFVSGQDTPANMAPLLGPSWQEGADIHKQLEEEDALRKQREFNRMIEEQDL